MPHFYVHALGDPYLDLQEINKIADKNAGALMAVDTIDASDITANRAQLPPKHAYERRDYLFYMEASDQDAAEYAAGNILATVLAERDKPVYSNLQQLLKEYPQASWRDSIQATLDHDDDTIALLIFVPGRSENSPAKIYYRGWVEDCCLDLIAHFTKIAVKR